MPDPDTDISAASRGDELPDLEGPAEDDAEVPIETTEFTPVEEAEEAPGAQRTATARRANKPRTEGR